MRWSLNPDENPELREMLMAQTASDFRDLSSLLEEAIRYLFETRGETMRTLALARIALDASEELRSFAESAWNPKSIRDMAWTTRNLLELLLRYHYVRDSDGNLRDYLAEQLRDEIDIYKSLKILSRYEGDEWADGEIQKVEATAVEKGYPIPKKPRPIAEIAKTVGMEDEYQAVYKLYSKWVHPTAWRLASAGFQSGFLAGIARRTFVQRAREYAVNLIELLAEDAVPGEDLAAAGGPAGPFDRPLPEIDEFDEMPKTSLDPGSIKRMKKLRADMKELGFPDPEKSPDSWKRRRVL